VRNSAHYAFALLIASFASVHAASAEMGDRESEFVRTGFYLGAGGTAAFGENWNSDFDGSFDEEASDLANENAQDALDSIPPASDKIIPLSVTVNGADLEGAQFGVNGVVGYRAGALVAFELEGEWLLSTDESDLDVDSVEESELGGSTILESSTGSHTAEIDDLWTITANVKVYPPFIGWLRPLARFQPFAKVGLGIQHAKFVSEIETSGLTTTDNAETIIVPADFSIRSTETHIDGALRVGGGIDIYATRNIVSEINASYVLPFTAVGPVKTDYVSVQWRLVYRF